MLNQLRQIFSAPIFEDEEKTRVAGLLNLVLLFVISGMVIALPILAITTTPNNVLPLVLVIIPYLLANIAAYAVMRRGRVQLAAYIFIAAGGIAIFAAYAASPWESIGAAMSFVILIAFTTLLLDARAVMRLIVFIILFTLAILVARENGWIIPVFTKAENAISEWISMTVVYFLTGIGLALSSRSLQRAVMQARAAAQEARASNQELANLRDALERRVTERTAELRATSQQNEKRALDLQTISEIGRAISSEQGLEKLLPLITNVVSDRFGFYHVGIFLLDEASNFAVLRAANSPGGQSMLKRGHRLEIGQVGLVGNVAASGAPRVALNVGEDAVYFNNPDLPETRSEIALPMTARGRIIGVLDVQSSEPAAFTNENVNSLSILADQIGIAIENARLLEATRRSLTEAETVYRQYMQREWSRFSTEEKLTGFRYAGGNSTPLHIPLELGESAHVVEDGKIHQKEASGEEDLAQLAVPVKVRGEVIAILNISIPGKLHWTDDDIDIIEAVAERVALSIENARLFQTTANRAERERIVSDIASKISGSIQTENILRTTAQALSQALNVTDVLIQLRPPRQPGEVQELQEQR